VSKGKEGSVLRIILVRHGQTEWNDGSCAGEHFRGQIDIGLNATGMAQAQSVADRLAPLAIKAVYASPLKRALDTARPVAQARGLDMIPLPGLLDIDYGQWGGRSLQEVAAGWPELYQRWKARPHLVHIPGGESLDQVRCRVSEGLDQILASHDREIVVLVGHQVVNKVLICKLFGLDNGAFWHIRQDTGCINRFDYDGQSFTVLTLNEVCHLLTYPRDLDELPAPP
jgi:broad specificity phosphatase PhoE